MDLRRNGHGTRPVRGTLFEWWRGRSPVATRPRSESPPETRPRARLDRLRDAELTEHGWQTVRLVADDLDDLPRTVRRVRLLLAALGRMPW